MKLLISALLSVALLLVSTMDAVHAAPHTQDMAATEMPHEDSDPAGMSCCDGLSSRTASCLGDIVIEMAGLTPVPSAPRALHLVPDAPIEDVGHAPETPTGPPKG